MAREENEKIMEVWNRIMDERVCSSFNDMLDCFAKRIINNYKRDHGYSLGFTSYRVLQADEGDYITIRHNVAYKQTTKFVIHEGELKELKE